ncbi:hypothetical protein JTE90_017934 [Oedothorax gibbosus]|uniref:Uncharacterized protein n=1 Tax=Oedothorax gibbosus TaxID=931172 RepID=A0AAV6V7Z9_9ARAC|nr:hypothetical protein JTE90_017934 [Oedothorax gibbosus]
MWLLTEIQSEIASRHVDSNQPRQILANSLMQLDCFWNFFRTEQVASSSRTGFYQPPAILGNAIMQLTASELC